MTNIIVNYRREDVPAEARRIRDSLAVRIGRPQVALTEEAAAAGRQLGVGDALVAIIGPRWLELMRGHASRNEPDPVRTEIATALRRGLSVIPLRVGRADAMPALPRAEDLPDDIRAMAQLGSGTITVEHLEHDTLAIAEAIAPRPVATARERLPGNSMLKMWLWAAGIMASTVLFANLTAYLTSPVWPPGSVQPAAQIRPALNFSAWSGESRIRRAIEAALAKGRRPDDARRCQSDLITATDSGTILFNTASAELDQRSHKTLDGLAQIIRNCPDFIVEVEGHTDNAGDATSNQRLSERRAVAVRDYLVRAGVPSSALIAAGYGELRPLAPNDTATNMARNRRIEFNVTVR